MNASGTPTLPVLLQALRDPRCMPGLGPGDWDRLVRQARHAGLLGRLHALAEQVGVLAALPAEPAVHLAAARRHAAAQADEARREVRHVRDALRGVGEPVILLKGAAYLLAGLPLALGRSFNDVDILLPKAALPEAESALLFHGWITTHHDPYDQRYYREWMHELPPMEHVRRGTVLDVHHNILPETARLRPPAQRLIEASVPLEGEPMLATLQPVDMLLHSMVHLLHNEELDRGLRDLSDLDLLLRHFGADADFWARLPARAEALGLQRVLFHGLTQAQALLHTPVPAAVMATIAPWGPPPPARAWMAAVWHRALGPLHPELRTASTRLALGFVFVRAHWLRMPWPLLLRHLAVKAWRGVQRPEDAPRKLV